MPPSPPNAGVKSYVLLQSAPLSVFPDIFGADCSCPDLTGCQIRQVPPPIVSANISCFPPSEQALVILHNIPFSTPHILTNTDLSL